MFDLDLISPILLVLRPTAPLSQAADLFLVTHVE